MYTLLKAGWGTAVLCLSVYTLPSLSFINALKTLVLHEY